MGLAIPQLAPASEDRVSGAQVIDGSLKFDGSQYLTRTPSSAGNRSTWTWSGWVKRDDVTTSGSSLFAAYDTSTSRDVLRFDRSASGAELNLQSSQGGSTYGIYSTAKFRDSSNFYHVVVIYDDTNGTTADKQQLYVNGQRVSPVSTENNGQDGGSTTINNTDIHYIGARSSDGNPSLYYAGRMSQVYFIDGQALGPESFGFTDPLTNTWRPKKYNTSTPTNNPNNGTTWSNNASVSSGSFGSGEEATKGFDGNTGTKAKTTANGASITITFSGINVERLLRIRTNYTNGTGSDVEVNDVSYGSAPTASDGEFKTISGFTGALTKIKLEAGGSVNAAFSAIEVDGVILQDSTTTNNRTWNSTVTFGTNGFNLPMDGNSPIGDDKSGQGNNWTPVNFGGTTAAAVANRSSCCTT